jgi:hypothetical protein
MFGSGAASEGGPTVKLFGESASNSSDPIPAMKAAVFGEPSAFELCCPNLTYTQRIIGFAICACTGYVLSLIGTLNLIGGFTDENVRLFALLYVGGNVVALCATGFLISPKKQCINMWKPTRRFTTAFYLSMLIIVFAVTMITPHQSIYLILFLLFIEVLAAVWYSLSYIPFGRDFVSSIIRKLGICFPCYWVYDEVQAQMKPKSNMPSLV